MVIRPGGRIGSIDKRPPGRRNLRQFKGSHLAKILDEWMLHKYVSICHMGRMGDIKNPQSRIRNIRDRLDKPHRMNHME